MDGTGREQDLGRTGHPLPDTGPIDDVPETLRREKGGEDENDAEEAPMSAEGKQAVRNQSQVTPDDYSGSSESGV